MIQALVSAAASSGNHLHLFVRKALLLGCQSNTQLTIKAFRVGPLSWWSHSLHVMRSPLLDFHVIWQQIWGLYHKVYYGRNLQFL